MRGSDSRQETGLHVILVGSGEIVLLDECFIKVHMWWHRSVWKHED